MANKKIKMVWKPAAPTMIPLFNWRKRDLYGLRRKGVNSLDLAVGRKKMYQADIKDLIADMRQGNDVDEQNIKLRRLRKQFGTYCRAKKQISENIRAFDNVIDKFQNAMETRGYANDNDDIDFFAKNVKRYFVKNTEMNKREREIQDLCGGSPAIYDETDAWADKTIYTYYSDTDEAEANLKAKEARRLVRLEKKAEKERQAIKKLLDVGDENCNDNFGGFIL